MSNVADPNANGSPEQETSTQALTQEDVVKVVNSAITSHLKRLDFNKQITSALETHLAPIKDLLGKTAPEAKIEEKSSDKTSASASPELLAMQKKMEMMEKQFKAREEMILAKEKSSREKEAFSKVKSELSSIQGIRAEGVDALAKLLKADGRLQIDEDGEVSYLDDDGETQLDLKSGLKKYLDPKYNPAAGLYLAPKTVLGKNKTNLPGRATASTSTVDKSLPPAERALLQIQQLQQARR